MPFRRVGNVIQKKVGGKWVTVQRTRSVSNAKAALRIRQASGK